MRSRLEQARITLVSLTYLYPLCTLALLRLQHLAARSATYTEREKPAKLMAKRREIFVIGRSAFMQVLCGVTGIMLVLLMTASIAAGPQSTERAAPEFVLRSLEGQNLRLSELRGEVVMINFWASWCGGCRQAMPALNELDEKYRRAGLTLLSVNVDDEEHRAEQMSRSLKIRFPVLRDGQKTVSRLYKADTLPLTVLIDREGNVRFSHTGYNVGDEQKYVAELRTLLNE